MFAFPTFTRAYERELQELFTSNWKKPEEVKKLGIYAGEGSAINFMLDSHGYPQYSYGTLAPINRNPPFLEHIICGKASNVYVGSIIYEHCYCKLGDYAKVVMGSSARPYCDQKRLGNICIQGKNFCDIEVTLRYADEPHCPDVGIIGGQFNLQLEISSYSADLNITAFDEPVRIFIDGTELPACVTPEMGNVNLTLSATEESRWHPVKVLRKRLRKLKQERNNSDEIRIKA